MDGIYSWRKTETGIDALEWAIEAAERGAGELLTSMDRDGTGKGFDLELLKSIEEKFHTYYCFRRSWKLKSFS